MIIVKVPELLREHKMNATDLMRHGNIAYATAHRLSHGNATAISFDVLENLCVLFQVKVGDILEYVPSDGKNGDNSSRS